MRVRGGSAYYANSLHQSPRYTNIDPPQWKSSGTATGKRKVGKGKRPKAPFAPRVTAPHPSDEERWRMLLDYERMRLTIKNSRSPEYSAALTLLAEKWKRHKNYFAMLAREEQAGATTMKGRKGSGRKAGSLHELN